MRIFLFVVLLAAGLSSRFAGAETDWRIETSLKYDAMCLIGPLAGDSFYKRYYEPELAELRTFLPEQTFAAAKGYAVFKEAGVLAGPWLALAYSVVQSDTPFDEKDERIVRFIELVRNDPFVYQRWKDHDPAFGYNTIEGYVDENVTKALDQLIGERVGMTFMDDVEQRWIQNDDGMHVLGAAVYELMVREKFMDGDESATEFRGRMMAEQKLVAGKIETLVPEKVRSAGRASQ